MSLRHTAALLLTTALLPSHLHAKTEQLATDPYRGAIVINAADGAVLFEDNADAIGYPASVLKLMTLLIVLEKVDAGALRLGERVTISAEAARMGGSQVYLKQGETFTIDELLDALIIQSANDAAVALAQHIAGSREAFVRMMNQKAAALGMRNTRFVSEHGLPPGADKTPDITTARDLAILGRALLAYPAVFRYTAIKERGFRNDSFIMRNHNRLLGEVEGVDGFKTGYFRAAGYSILATAQRSGVRIIAAVLGSASRELRDQKTRELLAAGFLAVPPPAPAPPPPSAEPVVAEAVVSSPVAESQKTSARSFWWRWPLILLAACVIGYIFYSLLGRPRNSTSDLLN
jgi:D-alanyl-D-alanine carboxypeptidase (penicillin-binding protein 5/6)